MDHHAHSILRAPPVDLDAFRGLFSESADPRQWPHVATTVTYQRAIELLAAELGCNADEDAVFDYRRSADPERYASELLAAAGAEALLLDEGYPPAADALSSDEMARLATCPVRPLLRLETLELTEDGRLTTVSLERVAAARDAGYAALKTIIAYRGGLDLGAVDDATRGRLTTALEVNRDTGDPLPVQIHTGFGDSDLLLPRADPSLLKPVFERFAETSFVLLHCYPFVRQAGWLASVYANVFIDLSLTIPHVSRPAAVLAEAVELAPLSKLLYASDAVRTPELYLLAARWWRDA
ncbi:MAG TPA: amidohydrolase family protein, partial [Solirubrobacteraceae bacterium]|nr:amidohydrolase family protein [Solirubrobacteraceae bacterium]